jgi:hypothetical protein
MAIFGVAWFIGSVVQGAVYDLSVPALVAVALVAQLAGAAPILIAARMMP